jgi:hypothetical protein
MAHSLSRPLKPGLRKSHADKLHKISLLEEAEVEYDHSMMHHDGRYSLRVVTCDQGPEDVV